MQTEETTVEELVSQQRDTDSVTNDNCNGK